MNVETKQNVALGDGRIYIFFTGLDSGKSGVPFLVDSQMAPITVVNAFLREIAKDGSTPSPYTWRTYGYGLFDWLQYLVSRGINWDEITADTIYQYRDCQDSNLSPHTGQPLDRKTINARLMLVHRFYCFAEEEGLIDKNPIKKKKLKSRRPVDADMLAHLGHVQVREVPSAAYERLPQPQIKWCRHNDVMRWLNSIKKWRDKLLSKLLYVTGMRRSEAISLCVRHLPPRGSINPSSLEVPVIITGKRRKTRTIYLPVREFFELWDYVEIERARLVRKAKKKHDQIFVGSGGEPLSPSSVNRIFRSISNKCNIWITPHMMRHSFAVRSLQLWKRAGLSQPEKLLQARLGHSSIKTTEIYMHLVDEDVAKEAHENARIIESFLDEEEE